MTGAISSLSFFRIIGLIPSGPGALSGLRFGSSLRLPFRSILMLNVDFRHFRIAALESFRYARGQKFHSSARYYE